jgi:signal transduction histidine kinase
MMMRRGAGRIRLPNMSTKTRRRVRMWFSQLMVLALGCLALANIWVAPLPDTISGPRPVNTLIFLLICLTLLWRQRVPVAVLFAVIFLVGVQAAFFDPSFQNPAGQIPFVSFLALIWCFYSVAAYSGMRRAVLAGAIAGVVILPAFLLTLRAGVNPGRIIPAWLFCASLWFIGRTVHQRQVQAARLQDLALQLELEREENAQSAVAEERTRIAREMHDVVAHSVSVMVVQSQAAQRLLEGEQRAARQALGSIETTGRQALTEMRRLLGTLRRTDAELTLAPQPSLRRLEDLIEHVREAGLPVELHVQGKAASLPPGVDLSAYRIVQEALTNTLKHAGASHAKVVVHYRDDELELEVTDDGSGNGNGGGSGQGMIGMRERVALYGGILESGKKVGGGYVVQARLPFDSNQP